jgi:glycopeptide antibiotics resistance protein
MNPGSRDPKMTARLAASLIAAAMIVSPACRGVAAEGGEQSRPRPHFLQRSDRAGHAPSPRTELLLAVSAAVAGGLLVCGFAAMYAAGRKGSVRPGEAPRTAGSTAAWPRRRHYFLVALFFAGIAVYGSLVPFHYAPLGFGEAVGQLKEILKGPVRPGSRSNFVANILLGMPISYCLLAALSATHRNRMWTVLCVPLVGALCAALSVAVEFAQLWIPERVASLSDIVAQIIGATAGMGLWLMVGQTITDWVRSYTVSKRPSDQVGWLLQAYLIGLLVYSVLPLDLISRPAELVHKYREGKIVLAPFSNAGWDFATFYGLVRDVVIFIPVGMLTATWMTSSGRWVRAMGTSVLLGGLVLLTVEASQLLLRNRVVASGDLLCGMLGVCVGAGVMRRWRGGGRADHAAPTGSQVARRAWLWLGLAAVYSLVLAAVFCWPLEPIRDLPQIKARFNGFFCLPFCSSYHNTEFALVSDILKKGLLFAPLGGLLALALAALPVPRPIRRILVGVALLGTSGVAISIEMAQVFLPPHVPSSTDVILCTAGAAIGMFVTLRIVDARRDSV